MVFLGDKGERKIVRSYLILGMCFLFLVQYFAEWQWLKYTVVVISLLAFLTSVKNADRFPRFLGLIMMSAGLLIEWNKGTGIDGVSNGIFLILPLLSLITLAPLLSIPLRLGGFFGAVSKLLHNLLHKPKKMYAGITGTLFLLSPILNLGSVRILNDFLEDLKLSSVMSAKGYVVGFTTAIMWSPYFASVSLILHYLNLPYTEYVLYGIALSILSLLIGNVLFALWEKFHPIKQIDSEMKHLDWTDRKQLIKLVLFVSLLMGSCLVLEVLTGWSMVVIVCLISILIPFIYGLLTFDWKRMAPLLVDYRDRTVPLLNNEIMLFMSAGMLAFALNGTSAMNGVGFFLADLADHSYLLFILAIIVIVEVVTFIGIHQIAVVGALAMQLNAAELGISNVALALILILTWFLSTALSPFSGLNLMVSRFSHVPGIQLGTKMNGVHLLVVTFIGIAIISFL